MCFKPKKLSTIHVSNFILDGKILDIVTSQKYLGVFINDQLTDDDDIHRQTKCIYAKGNILVKKFSNCSNNVKGRLFQSYCTTFYCDQLWCRYKTSSFSKLQSSYNKMIRCLFKLDRMDSISAKCIEFKIDCFKVLLRKSVFGFRNRVLDCDNILVKCLTQSQFFYTCVLNTKWSDMLFCDRTQS